MSEIQTVQARILGHVQGVSFRAWAQTEACLRGLTGWVRNEADGSVTAVFRGPSETIREMTRALEHGPPAAVVRAVEIAPTDWPDSGRFDILS